MTTELPAGGVDVLTALESQGSTDTAIFEVIPERATGGYGGLLVGKAFDGVVGDQVYVGLGRGDEIDEFISACDRIVAVFEERPFEGDLPAGLIDVVVDRVHEALNVVLAVQGYELVAQLIVRGV